MDGAPLEIRALRADDAAALVGCFDRCYAGTYPADAFHDPGEIAALVQGGRLRSVVAVDAAGDVVGHMGLRLRAKGARTAEAGNTVVDPRYRGHHLAARLGLALKTLASESGLLGWHGFPTTAHPVVQKLEVLGGGVEVGVLLDYIPAETDYVGIDGAHDGRRVAVVVIFNRLQPVPSRPVYVPRRYARGVQAVYERCGLVRIPGGEPGPLPSGSTALSARHELRRGLLRIEVETLGADVRERVLSEAGRVAPPLVVIDLPLGDAALDAATEDLVDAGFFFGAVLPEYAPAGDVLRLQRPRDVSSLPSVATDDARTLLAYVLADRDGTPT